VKLWAEPLFLSWYGTKSLAHFLGADHSRTSG
jgi:hypothetical protein